MIADFDGVVRYLGAIGHGESYCVDSARQPPLRICKPSRWLHTCSSNEDVAQIFRQFLETTLPQFTQKFVPQLRTFYTYWQCRSVEARSKNAILDLLSLKLHQHDAFYFFLFIARTEQSAAPPLLWKIIQSDLTGSLFFRLRYFCRSAHALLSYEQFVNTAAFNHACLDHTKDEYLSRLVASLDQRGLGQQAETLFKAFMMKASDDRAWSFYSRVFARLDNARIAYLIDRWRPNITYLNSSQYITPQIAAVLSTHCPNLRDLSVNVELEDASAVCEEIAKCRSLQSLELRVFHVYDSSRSVQLNPLTDLGSSLHSLYLFNARLTEDSMKFLSCLTSLQKLSLNWLIQSHRQNGSDHCAAAFLAHAPPSLTYLRLVDQIREISLCIPKIVLRLTNLQEIVLHPWDLEPKALEDCEDAMQLHLKGLTSLKRLEIEQHTP